MYIVVIGWMYVVLMMSIAEVSIVAGIMTFVMYGALPLVIIIYIGGARQRKRNRASAESIQENSAAHLASPLADEQPESVKTRTERQSNDKPKI